MDRFEALVRDTLTEHALDAPVALRRRGPRRPRTATWAAVAAISVVLLLAVGLAASDVRRDTVGAVRTPMRRGGSTKPTTVAPARIAGNVPAGYKIVSYHGVEVSVPKSLSVTHSPCAPPVNAVYAPNGVGYSCPANIAPTRGRELSAHATAVWLQAPRSRVTSGRQPSGRRTVAGVTVSVTAPTRAEVNSILTSIRAVTVDHLGCPSHPDPITPTGQLPTKVLVPIGAVSAVVCELAPIGTHNGYWLVGSQPLSPNNVAPLAEAVDALRTGVRTRAGYAELYDLVRFRYADGTVRVIAIPTDYAPAYVTDGRRTAKDTNPGIDLLPLLPQD